MKVIYLRGVEDKDHKALTKEAKNLGLTLTGYCRMKLIELIKKDSSESR